MSGAMLNNTLVVIVIYSLSNLEKIIDTALDTVILTQDHRAMFIPKFHCELNPIERVWCRAKQYTCSHCDILPF